MLIWPWWEASEIPPIIYLADFLHFSSEQIFPFQQTQTHTFSQTHTRAHTQKRTQKIRGINQLVFFIKYMLCVVLGSRSSAPMTNSWVQSPAGGMEEGGRGTVNICTHTLHRSVLCVFGQHWDVMGIAGVRSNKPEPGPAFRREGRGRTQSFNRSPTSAKGSIKNSVFIVLERYRFNSIDRYRDDRCLHLNGLWLETSCPVYLISISAFKYHQSGH